MKHAIRLSRLVKDSMSETLLYWNMQHYEWSKTMEAFQISQKGYYYSMNDREVARVYAAVADEYNQSPLATQEGWTYSPSFQGFLHMRAIANYLSPNGLLVDIGTGCGIGARFGLKLGARVISIDSSDASGLSALQNVKLAGAEVYSCDLLRDQLPVESETADCVLFSDVIEHLLHSPKPGLLEIKRILKPGGVCVASTPNSTRLSVRLKLMFGFSNWPDIHDFFHAPGHFGHHHEYSITEFRYVFEESGFTVKSFELYEHNLRATRIHSLDQLGNHDRKTENRRPESLKYRLAKVPFIALTQLAPSLRSNMLLIASKPV